MTTEKWKIIKVLECLLEGIKQSPGVNDFSFHYHRGIIEGETTDGLWKIFEPAPNIYIEFKIDYRLPYKLLRGV